MSHPYDPGNVLRQIATPFGWLMLVVSSWTMGLALTALAFAINPEAHSFIVAWLCDGQITHSSYDNSLRPGEIVTVHAVYCTDGSGARSDITFLAFVVVVPLLYACLSAIVLVLAWRLLIKPCLSAVTSLATAATASNRTEAVPDIASMLEQASALFEAGAITEQELAGIRADILSRLSAQAATRRT